MQSHTKKWKKNWKKKVIFFHWMFVNYFVCKLLMSVYVWLLVSFAFILSVFFSASLYLYLCLFISVSLPLFLLSQCLFLYPALFWFGLFSKNAHFLSTLKFMNSKIFILKCQQFIALSDNLKNATSKKEKNNLFYCLNHFITIFFSFLL